MFHITNIELNEIIRYYVLKFLNELNAINLIEVANGSEQYESIAYSSD